MTNDTRVVEEVQSQDSLRALLKDISQARIAVIGDFCLDVYWFADMAASELSVETSLPTRPVASQRCSLGGAGNVVNNLVALGCRQVRAYGVLGNDPWGREMLHLLADLGVNTSAMLTDADRWATLTYIKPHVDEKEVNRFDFGNFNALSDATAGRLLDQLRQDLDQLDVVVINQQVPQGIHTPFLRQKLAELIQAAPEKIFVVDSRHYSDDYQGAYLKINDHEAARMSGIERPYDSLILKSEAVAAAEQIYARTRKPVLITRGRRGCLVRDERGLFEIPGIQVMGKIDTVGAGDSMLAGIASVLATRRDPVLAGTLGNFVASITIQKLHQTGTASPEEILAIANYPDYIYRPEIAEDPRQARYYAGSEIEVISEVRPGLRITHAIFDHDGTISTLRQGWELIMEPMMVRAILGPKFDSADESLYQQVVSHVRSFIDKSTGIQTLIQMQGLVKMVREFGCVPEPEILDEFGYKKIYNDGLIEVVSQRLDKLQRGELSIEDFTVKNAVAFITALHKAGVRLYLASGTDEVDVVAEVKALGYAHIFEGGVYGAVGDVTKEAKREVLERILKDIGQAGGDVITFGDGPVEIRETHKRGGITVGVASDEVRRYGLEPSKRARLIRAGADLIIPDYSQMDRLLGLLNL